MLTDGMADRELAKARADEVARLRTAYGTGLKVVITTDDGDVTLDVPNGGKRSEMRLHAELRAGGGQPVRAGQPHVSAHHPHLSRGPPHPPNL